MRHWNLHIEKKQFYWDYRKGHMRNIKAYKCEYQSTFNGYGLDGRGVAHLPIAKLTHDELREIFTEEEMRRFRLCNCLLCK